MFYFQKFPAIEYQTTEVVDGTIQPVRRLVPNMTVKFIMNIFADENLAYTTYRIMDRDRPDTLAAQLYGSARYAWVILVANNMRDWYDWPMSDFEFVTYLNKKYESALGVNDGAAVAAATIAEYRWLRSDGQVLVIDEAFYNTLPVDNRTVKTVYQKEYDDNDVRRLVRLPTVEALPTILRQFDVAAGL